VAETAKGYPSFNGTYSQEDSPVVAGCAPEICPALPSQKWGISAYLGISGSPALPEDTRQTLQFTYFEWCARGWDGSRTKVQGERY